jgi:hypothetical protein
MLSCEPPPEYVPNRPTPKKKPQRPAWFEISHSPDPLLAVTIWKEAVRPTVRCAIRCYNSCMQRKVFWASFAIIGLIADLVLPFWWAMAATIPIGVASWWIAYRSDWF